MYEPSNRVLSISVETPLNFDECLACLRASLRRARLSIVAEIPFDREFKEHLGLSWARYTVIVVWSPFHAYQGVLNDREAGILLPFHFVVAETTDGTSVAATNLGLLGEVTGRIGLRLVSATLMQQIRQTLDELHMARRDGTRVPPSRQSEGYA